MLRIYDVTLEMIDGVAEVALAIDKCDPDLARQLRRAASSVPLNVAEGAYSQGRNANARFYTAMGSASEVMACLDIAEHMRYAAVDPKLRDTVDRILATMRKLIRRTTR